MSYFSSGSQKSLRQLSPFLLSSSIPVYLPILLNLFPSCICMEYLTMDVKQYKINCFSWKQQKLNTLVLWQKTPILVVWDNERKITSFKNINFIKGISYNLKKTLKGTEGALKNGQSRETGNIWITRRRKTKQKHNTICTGHNYAQINTHNVNKTWVLLNWKHYLV